MFYFINYIDKFGPGQQNTGKVVVGSRNTWLDYSTSRKSGSLLSLNVHSSHRWGDSPRCETRDTINDNIISALEHLNRPLFVITLLLFKFYTPSQLI